MLKIGNRKTSAVDTQYSYHYYMYFFALKGVDFLDAVLVVSQERRWASEAFKTECKRWFSLLLKAVEIKKGIENILASFLDSGKAVTQHKEYKPHIEAEVCSYVCLCSTYKFSSQKCTKHTECFNHVICY